MKLKGVTDTFYDENFNKKSDLQLQGNWPIMEHNKMSHFSLRSPVITTFISYVAEKVHKISSVTKFTRNTRV